MSPSLCHPGAKHKSMLEGHSTQMRRGRGKLLSRAGHKSKRIGNKGSINIQNKAFHCQVCEIYVNSETQLKQVRTPSLVRFFSSGRCRGSGHGRAKAPGAWVHIPSQHPMPSGGEALWRPGFIGCIPFKSFPCLKPRGICVCLAWPR